MAGWQRNASFQAFSQVTPIDLDLARGFCDDPHCWNQPGGSVSTAQEIHRREGMDARTIVFLLVATNLGSGQVLGQAAGNADGKTWWNPMTWTMGSNEATRPSSSFGMTEKKPASATMFSTPKLPWVSGDSATTVKSDFGRSMDSAKKSSTSTLSRMGQSTKRAWNSTVDFLNPFDSGGKPAKQQQGYQPQNVQSKPGGGMFGWMWREEKVESPSTVNEFLRQERPRF